MSTRERDYLGFPLNTMPSYSSYSWQQQSRSSPWWLWIPRRKSDTFLLLLLPFLPVLSDFNEKSLLIPLHWLSPVFLYKKSLHISTLFSTKRTFLYSKVDLWDLKTDMFWLLFRSFRYIKKIMFEKQKWTIFNAARSPMKSEMVNSRYVSAINYQLSTSCRRDKSAPPCDCRG